MSYGRFDKSASVGNCRNDRDGGDSNGKKNGHMEAIYEKDKKKVREILNGHFLPANIIHELIKWKYNCK